MSISGDGEPDEKTAVLHGSEMVTWKFEVTTFESTDACRVSE
jgi:hypothetical protein